MTYFRRSSLLLSLLLVLSLCGVQARARGRRLLSTSLGHPSLHSRPAPFFPAHGGHQPEGFSRGGFAALSPQCADDGATFRSGPISRASPRNFSCSSGVPAASQGIAGAGRPGRRYSHRGLRRCRTTSCEFSGTAWANLVAPRRFWRPPIPIGRFLPSIPDFLWWISKKRCAAALPSRTTIRPRTFPCFSTPGDWETRRKGSPRKDIMDALLSSPALARLYWALSRNDCRDGYGDI